jgi:Plasmid recombination enzyme
MHLNYTLTGDGTPEDIALHAKVQMLKVGIEKPRKGGVMAVEIVFSLPIERHSQDTRQFFIDCLQWTKAEFKCEVLSFDTHLDESCPHAHAIILPLIGDKMNGNKIIGGIGNLWRLLNSFYKEVAQYHGLQRSHRERLNKADKQALEREVLKRLASDSVMLSSVWPIVRDTIRDDPLSFARILSIRPNKASSKVVEIKPKSFVDHKRSKGKGSFIA